MSTPPNDEARPNHEAGPTDPEPPAAARPAPAAGAASATAWQPPPRISVGRALAIIVLGLGVAGFGLCSLCGGVMGVASLTDKGRMSGDIALTAFGFSAVGALITWLCWWGMKRVRRGGTPTAATAAAAPGAATAAAAPGAAAGRPAAPSTPDDGPPPPP